jgi:hypothetical protein
MYFSAFCSVGLQAYNLKSFNFSLDEGYHRKQQVIAYADDVALITRSKKEIEKAFSKLEKATRGYGLRINEEKTKYLIMKQKSRNHTANSGQKNNLESVKYFE